MSTAASPSPVRSDPPLTQGRPRVSWSWPSGARVLLTALAIIAVTGLWAASRDVPSATEPMAAGPELVLDANTAPAQVLAALPHFGPTLANRLVEARSEGPFRSLEEVKERVRGLGP